MCCGLEQQSVSSFSTDQTPLPNKMAQNDEKHNEKLTKVRKLFKTEKTNATLRLLID